MKKRRKEYGDFPGLRNSFLATISLARKTWDLASTDAVDWYIEHVEGQGRLLTADTARMFHEALEAEFDKWIAKNYKPRKLAVSDDIQSAINFLREHGYTVSREQRSHRKRARTL